MRKFFLLLAAFFISTCAANAQWTGGGFNIGGGGAASSVDLSDVTDDITFSVTGKGLVFSDGATLKGSAGPNLTVAGGAGFYGGYFQGSSFNAYGTMGIFGQSAAAIPMDIYGATSQSGHLTNWRNDSGTVLGYIGSDGSATLPALTLSTTALTIANGGTSNAYGSGLLSNGVVTQNTGTTTLTASSTPLQTIDGTNRTINLPVASTCPGKTFLFMRGTGAQAAITFGKQGSDTINGAAGTYKLSDAAGRMVIAVSDGNLNWNLSAIPYLTTTTSAAQFPYIDSNGNTSYASAASTIYKALTTDSSGYPGYGAPVVHHGTNSTAGTVAITADSDDIETANTTSGDVNYTLPTASSCNGKIIRFIKTVAANNMVVNSNTARSINGSTAAITVTTQYAGLAIVSDGSNWYKLHDIP